MAKIFVKFASPATVQKIIVTWNEFTTPLAEIGRMVYNAPHPERSITISNINPVMHTVNFWKSTDGVTLETLAIKIDADASAGNPELNIYEYVVDRGESGVAPNWSDPISATSTLPADDRLKGVTTFYVEKRGAGKLRSDEVTYDTVNGQFTLVNDQFWPDDTYFAVANAVSSVVQQAVISTDYTDIVEMPGNLAHSSANHNRKVIVCNSGNLMPIYSLSSIGAIPNGKIKLTTHQVQPGFRYLKIPLSGADTIWLNGDAKNVIYMGVGESVEIMFKNGSAYIIDPFEAYQRLGMMVWGRMGEKNRLTLDGSEYTIAELGRLYTDYIDKLPADQVVDYATWASPLTIDGVTEYPYKALFAKDNATQKIKLPDMRDRIVKGLKLNGVDASRLQFDKAGALQLDAVGPLGEIHIRDGAGGGNTGTINNTGFSGQDNPATWRLNGKDGGGLEKYIRRQLTPPETLVRNIGFIPQIII